MRMYLLTLALFVSVAGAPALAGDHVQDGKHAAHGKNGRGACCPHCGEVCYPTVSKEKETKTCWEIDTKTICIPKVRFPWEAGCCGKGCGKDGCPPPKCGRTKCVNVLMEHEYECSTCKYSWDVDKHKNGDSDKYDTDKYEKATGDDVKEDAGEVPAPPSLEARLRYGNPQHVPVRWEAETAPATGRSAGLADFFGVLK